jgi:hypothetical protein
MRAFFQLAYQAVRLHLKDSLIGRTLFQTSRTIPYAHLSHGFTFKSLPWKDYPKEQRRFGNLGGLSRFLAAIKHGPQVQTPIRISFLSPPLLSAADKVLNGTLTCQRLVLHTPSRNPLARARYEHYHRPKCCLDQIS